MYDLMDDLVLFSDREGTSVISKISRIYKKSPQSGDADIKKKRRLRSYKGKCFS